MSAERIAAGKMPDRRRYVLDTSALLALRGDERGADEVERLLNVAAQGRAELLVSFMTRMELFYLIRRDESDDAARAALRLVDSFDIEWVSCEAAVLEAAAAIKSRGGLSVADAWIAGTAIARRAVLVHRDAEYSSLAELEQQAL